MTTYLKLVKGATKIKMAPPKQKYIDPILLGTSQQQDFQEIVRALGPRINDSAFTIAYKSLIVIHLMMREGDRDVAIRYFSRDLEFFNVSNASRSGNGRFESHALERYNSYLKERCQEFSITQIDYVRDGYSSLRSIINDRHNNSINKALNHVESLETQITSLLKNKYSIGDLSNDLLLFAFKLLVFDLLALYNALNEGIITLLESFFELSHNNAERTLDLYKNFVDLTESVVRYLKTGKAVGLKIPVIKHITTKLVRSLEEHLREDNITHNTFNDENNNGNGNNNNNNLAVDSPSKGLAQKRLDEIREQKRQLQEQLSHPQLLINSTGSNNPMMMQQATTLPQMNLQQLPQQQVAQPQMAPQMTANNPFMNQMHTQQQVPQQANIQPQVPPNNLQYTNTAPIMMTQNDIMQQQQQQMLQQQIPQQVPQQQAPQLNMSMTMPSLPEQPLPTGNNNPFSVNNVNATQQIQEQNNPFSQTNYQQPLQQATTLQSTSTNNNSNNNFMQGNVTTATASTSNNPFALPGQPQQSQPQSHALQTAMTAPVSMNQTVPQYNQPFAQQAPQQYMQQQQQQQQPFMQQPQQQQEINLIDF